MNDITFRHPPIALISGLDDHQAYAAGFPDQCRWMQQNAIPFQLSVYRWPEMLACLLGRNLGTTVYEITVIVPENYAEAMEYGDDA